MNPANVLEPNVRVAKQSLGSWLHVTDHVDPGFGGICAVVPALCSAIALSSGCDVSLAGFCGPEERFPESPSFPIHRYPPGLRRWVTDGSLRQRLNEHIRSVEGVHIHGLWREHCSLSGWAARRQGKPYLISAHGMLESWALKNKALKKQIYSFVAERKNLSRATCLHALTGAEAHDYRRFGIRTPVAVIPNGVEIPPAPSSELFFHAYPELREKRNVLFLGRLHPKKGLGLLCDAWPQIRQRCADAHLVIAGPDFEGTQAKLATLIRERGIEGSVTFTGMLQGEIKWSALRAAQVFVLPSFSEGLSVSVLEAMGVGIPVVVTDACNIPEVRDHNAGRIVRPESQEIAAAVSELLLTTGSSLAEMGSNGSTLVRRNYSWFKVGAQMSAVYEWMNGGAVPRDVEMAMAK